MGRIEDKKKEIIEYLRELEEILPNNLEEYGANKERKAACERYFEKIVEACVDLTFITIKMKKFYIPKEDADSFFILADNKIITKKIAEKLKDAKGMRNVLAHKYGEINDELIFHSLTEELIKDVEEFLEELR